MVTHIMTLITSLVINLAQESALQYHHHIYFVGSWKVRPGLPYEMVPWQVGESREHNGSFKKAFVKAKQEL